MAVELCSEASTWVAMMSPRISFSQDLSQSDGTIPVDRHGLDPTFLDSDFNFCIRCEQESSSADELFSGGKIRPLLFSNSIHVRPNSTTETSNPPKSSSANLASPMPLPKDAKRESLREVMAICDAAEKHSAPPKSFWRFSRSSSLNLGHGYKTICSLPLLSRSNSTGSINLSSRPPQQQPRPPPKENYKSSQKSVSNQNPKPLATTTTTPSLFQRPALKKNGRNGKAQLRSYGNGVRISPVLNVPPYIPKGATGLFCFGFFCNGKDAKSKKKSSNQSL